jgi:putative transposase
MDEKTRQDVALFRISVLGPLVGARLEHGDLVELCREAAGRAWELPNGEVIEVSARTIENWFYLYQRGGFAALHPKRRSDKDKPRVIPEALAELIVRAKREKPSRSVRRIIRALERAKKVQRDTLTKSTVHRLLQVHGASRRPLAGPGVERRSFIHEHVGDLWVGDAVHGRRHVIAPDGRLRKPCLFSQIDGASRYVPHSYFVLAAGEDSVDQEYGFKQAMLAHGRPRMYYVDRGPAYIAKSLRAICAELHVRLLYTKKRDAAAKGVIEKFNRTWREEVEDELPDKPIPFAELIAKHDAWLSVEYHARKHDTTGRAPRELWLEQVDQLRPLPPGKSLDEIFLHREYRTVRKDGTVRFGGGFLEVRAELSGKVELRFDPSRPELLPKIFVNNCFACDTVPLDRIANSRRPRRSIVGAPVARIEPSGLDPLALIQAEHELRTRPLSGALTPEDVHDETDDSTQE